VSDRRGTAVRLGALAAALLGLLALVALGSRAGLPWTETGEGSEGRSLALIGRLVVDVLVVAVAVLLLAVFAIRMRRPELGRPPDDEEEEEDEEDGRLGKLVVRVGSYVLLAGIVLVTFLFAREVDRRFPRGEPPNADTTQGGPGRDGSLTPPADTASWLLAAAGALVIVALVASVAVPAVRRLRAARAPDEAGLGARAVARVLDESIDDLWAESDPRRAVIAAYARMERGLAARGQGRRPFEAPLEYVGRVLSELGAGRESVQRLTMLFERAKFSRHPIAPEAKAEAIDCLVSIRGGLA
jgi:membrane protein implicated in regulation of membrane protease activity